MGRMRTRGAEGEGGHSGQGHRVQSGTFPRHPHFGEDACNSWFPCVKASPRLWFSRCTLFSAAGAQPGGYEYTAGTGGGFGRA